MKLVCVFLLTLITGCSSDCDLANYKVAQKIDGRYTVVLQQTLSPNYISVAEFDTYKEAEAYKLKLRSAFCERVTILDK